MAKLLYLMNTSLDGYVEDAQGSFNWSVPHESVNTYINEIALAWGTYLYGHRMYDSMVYWETEYKNHNLAHYHHEWAQIWQAADKIVYSTTLIEPRSARTRIERQFSPDAIRQLKADASKDITIQGPELAAHALQAGLVDELQLFVHPIVVGGGKKFLPDGLPLKLELIEERAFANGVITVRYAVSSTAG